MSDLKRCDHKKSSCPECGAWTGGMINVPAEPEQAGKALDLSWREAALAWQEWATKLCHQPEGGELGDGPMRAQLGERLTEQAGKAQGWAKNPRYEPKTLQQKLGYLVEECGEVAAAAGKTIRWGLDSYNPDLPPEQRESNQDWLMREMEDLECAIRLLRAALLPAPPTKDPTNG